LRRCQVCQFQALSPCSSQFRRMKVSLHEPTGAVAEEILNQADVLNADLIVMGTHGHGAMYNLLLGCATKGVLKHSTRPVLLVPDCRS
jgi:nucleotide-binding universal stress UspA family protein